MSRSIFDPAVLEADPGRRRLIVGLLESATQGVDPMAAVLRTVHREGDELVVAGRHRDLTAFDRVVVIGVGKASVAMARGVTTRFADRVVTGTVVSNAAAQLDDVAVIVGGHPVPNASSITGARTIMDTAGSAGSDDLLVVLISGGGSSLAELPAGDLELDDLVAVTDQLLRSGATIQEINAVRKHLSAFKGGNLAEAAADAGDVVTLVLSDVVGNPLDVIASGPTVADPTTYGDALAVLERRAVLGEAPDAVVDHLRRGAAGAIPETPDDAALFESQQVVIVGDAATAGNAVVAEAERRGISGRLVTSTLTGEAKEAAQRVVEACLQSDQLLVFAGETTVTVTGDGTGGRNQELALAAGIALEGHPGAVVASFGTDGIDGPTPAAGAIGDGHTVQRARAAGIDPHDALARNDSHPLLAATGDLLITGPTGTNVGDVVVAFRSPR